VSPFLSSDNDNSAKRPRFIVLFVVTSLIGVLLISLAVYRASKELEVIHDVDNMSRIIRSLWDKKTMAQVARGEQPFGPGHGGLPADSDYRFFAMSASGLRALQPGGENDLRLLQSVDLESTRVNARGGYFEADGTIRTWVKFHNSGDPQDLLVVHNFRSAGAGELIYVYRQRMVIPVLFYLWLMVWVSLMFNHLLSQLRAQKDKMAKMALHDPLTGLPNRTLMQDRLSEMIRVSRRNARPFAFFVIDLNGFKAINDQYGHVYGDELLRAAAKRIAGALRASDIAARFGGDEFTVLLGPPDTAAWRQVCERIQAALSAPYRLTEKRVTISASIGVALFPEHGQDAETLLLNADRAMYVAKACRGGIHLFDPVAASGDNESTIRTARLGGASAYQG